MKKIFTHRNNTCNVLHFIIKIMQFCFSLCFEKISFALVHLHNIVRLECFRSNLHDKILEPFPSWFLFNIENMKKEAVSTSFPHTHTSQTVTLGPGPSYAENSSWLGSLWTTAMLFLPNLQTFMPKALSPQKLILDWCDRNSKLLLGM